MLAQAIAGALDLDDDRVMQEAVEESRCDNGIAEDLAPFGESAVRREDHGALFISSIDELEEQIAAAWDDGQIADLVDHQEGSAREIADALAQRSLALGLGERSNNICESGEDDASAGFDRFDGERCRQMTLAVPGGPRRCTTSARSMKFSSASAMMR